MGKIQTRTSKFKRRILATSLGLALLGTAALVQRPSTVDTQTLIIQGSDLAAVKTAVQSVGGEITHELGIIDAVGAALTAAQIDALKHTAGITRVCGDAEVEVAGKADPETFYPSLVGADQLHAEGIMGAGVGVAVLDSGGINRVAINKDTNGWWRHVAQYDAISDDLLASLPVAEITQTSGVGIYQNDEYGHGVHVASVALSSANTGRRDTKYSGVAPDAYLISVKAFGANGSGAYADVIRGIDWVVANKDLYNTRVLNLSFSAPPRSHYWEDPLNQAVMAAWEAGIVVVASAGNTGPEAQTIGVPGNTPYVITVGAMSDNWTQEDGSDDVLASFSAAGPTYDGFLKPEVVAPGGHILGQMGNDMQLVTEHPEFFQGGTYFEMSGTSQSAAVVSGVAALLLQADPSLSPDDVKCRLIASARPALDASGELAYSPLQQGAGQVNAYDAVYSTESGCANRGMDVSLDLDDAAHYGGPINQRTDGSFYLMDPAGGAYDLWGRDLHHR